MRMWTTATMPSNLSKRTVVQGFCTCKTSSQVSVSFKFSFAWGRPWSRPTCLEVKPCLRSILLKPDLARVDEEVLFKTSLAPCQKIPIHWHGGIVLGPAVLYAKARRHPPSSANQCLNLRWQGRGSDDVSLPLRTLHYTCIQAGLVLFLDHNTPHAKSRRYHTFGCKAALYPYAAARSWRSLYIFVCNVQIQLDLIQYQRCLIR